MCFHKIQYDWWQPFIQAAGSFNCLYSSCHTNDSSLWNSESFHLFFSVKKQKKKIKPLKHRQPSAAPISSASLQLLSWGTISINDQWHHATSVLCLRQLCRLWKTYSISDKNASVIWVTLCLILAANTTTTTVHAPVMYSTVACRTDS